MKPLSLPLLALSAGAALAQSLNFDFGAALGSLNTDKVTEGSGAAVSVQNPGTFWTHNDGPNDHIYAFRMDGTLLADFDFSKNPDDIEDIASGPGPDPSLHYLYVGDIGSNTANRDVVHIYRLAEPSVDPAWANDPVSHTIDKGVDNCQLKYPDGKFDAEALLVDPIRQELYIATKEDDQTHLFRIALSQLEDGKTRDLEFVRTMPLARVNGGSISADGQYIALRSETYAVAWIRNPGESVADALTRTPTNIPIVGPPDEPNGEAIAFLPDNSGYITVSEGENPPVYFFRRLTETCNDAPRFTEAPRVTTAGVTLNFTACTGATIAIERASTLGDWSQIATVTVNVSAGSFTDPSFPGPAFYRLRVTP
jgi:hypothetical protein